MVKLNAQVEESTRDRIRALATSRGSSVQSVTTACIEAGLTKLRSLPAAELGKLLSPDRRRAESK